MSNSDDIGLRLMRTGVFQAQEEMMFYILLNEMQKQSGPVGSWALYDLLTKQGMNYSTATIGRYLKMLDGKGYTVRKSNQGRIMTPGGAAWVNEKTERLARAEMHDEASQALQANEYTDLIGLIRARKVIELATVEIAAREATDEELAALRRSVSVYYRHVAEKKDHDEPAFDFHSIIAEMSHNKFFKNLLDILIFEEMQMESHMDKLITRDRGGVYVVQHDDIASALQARDVELSKRLMAEHMDQMLGDVEMQIEQIRQLQAAGLKTDGTDQPR